MHRGLVDLALIGGIKSESLPQHTHNLKISATSTPGGQYAILVPKTTVYDEEKYEDTTYGANGETYQDNAPVQQEAVQYPYCIVVNTGVDEAERPINNYQVNNVYSYGMSQYYKGTMNNNSWLKSAGQWNDGTVYTGMYNWLLEQMNAGVSGYVASTATYTDYDFVINTTDQTFRLPLKNGEENLVDYSNPTSFALATNFTVPTNGIIYASVSGYSGTAGAWYWTVNGGEHQVFGGNQSGSFLTSVEVKRGDVFYIVSAASANNTLYFYPYISDGTLYYYIGDTLQNAQLINVARIEESLTDVNAASRGYVVDSYHNGTDWYRIYSDGWIEQGGLSSKPASEQEVIIYFLKPFLDTNYTFVQNVNSIEPYAGVFNMRWVQAWGKQKDSIKVWTDSLGKNWFACGYIR